MRTLHIIGAAMLAFSAVVFIPVGIVEHDLGMGGGGVCALMLGVETWRRRPPRRR